jgi:predicted glycosyltransferase
MNFLIDIAHPAHVHLFRNVYFLLKDRGHQVYVTVKNIPSAIQLLNIYHIPYYNIGNKKDSIFEKGVEQLLYDIKVLGIVKRKNIQVGFGSSITIAHVSKLSRMKSIIFDDDDDEVEPLFAKYAHPFSNVVLSPDCAIRKTKKLVQYAGYHELAYLHPNRFTPDEMVLAEAGLTTDDTYFLLRFNSFKAHHDIGVKGLSIENKRQLIDYLSSKGKVFITTERNIDDEFKKYQLKISPEKVHSFMYYATMLIGDSQTMTSEAAVLGTPSIRCNSFVGRISYLEEEEHKYGLTYGFLPDNYSQMQAKIESLLSMNDLKQQWVEKRKIMLNDKIDVTAFQLWFIENYPKSGQIIKNDPLYQLNFK